MVATSLAHLSKTSCYRMIKLADPAFTKLTRFLTPKEIDVIAFGTIQKLIQCLILKTEALQIHPQWTSTH